MSEPDLPVLPESLLAYKPKLSGAFPVEAAALMLVAAPLISLLLGVVGHYVGILIGYLAVLAALIPNLLASACGFVVYAFVIFAVIVIGGAFLAYPYLLGAANGQIVGVLGKRGHCRSPGLASWAGALNGVFVYLGHAVVALLVSGGLHPMTVTTARIGDLFDTVIYGTPWWITVLVVIEFGLVVFGARQSANDAVSKSFYCERHKVWYGDWQKAMLPIDSAPAVAAAVRSQRLRYLGATEPLEEKTYPHLVLKMRGCPSSQRCPVELAATAHWEETEVDKKGNTSTKTKSKAWFDLVMPAAFGYALDRTLGLQEELPD
jgi:hypothetical protein